MKPWSTKARVEARREGMVKMRRYILVGLMGISLGWTAGALVATESAERRWQKLLDYSRGQTQRGIDNYDQLLATFKKFNDRNEKTIEGCLGSLDHAAVVMDRQTATLRRMAGMEGSHGVK